MWGSTKNMYLGISICVLLWFMAGKLCLCNGGDTLSRGQSLSGSQTLISKDGIFELGFFTPGAASSQKTYLGIWHKDFPERTVVWVANREAPLPVTSPKFGIAPSGNLGLFHDFVTLWSTNLSSTLPGTVEAVLLDNGNLILRDGLRPAIIFWQSFEHPTDTWLPGAALGFNKITGRNQHLISWKNTDDPSPGMYSLQISQDLSTELFLRWNMSTTYWRSGVWNGIAFSLVPQIHLYANFTFASNENGTYCRYSALNHAVYLMFVVTASGELKPLASLRSHHKWGEILALPNYPFCGEFGIYSENPSNPCTCLQGFAPISRRPNDWSSGCYRKAPLQCETNEGKKDGFLEISDVKLTDKSLRHPAQSAKGCELACQQNCNCTAYAVGESGCLIWEGALLNLSQHIPNNDGHKKNWYLKVSNSELQTAKGCCFSW